MVNWFYVSVGFYWLSACGLLAAFACSWAYDVSDLKLSTGGVVFVSHTIGRAIGLTFLIFNGYFAYDMQKMKDRGGWRYIVMYFILSNMGPIAILIMDPTFQSSLKKETTFNMKGTKYATMVSTCLILVTVICVIFTSRHGRDGDEMDEEDYEDPKGLKEEV